MEINITNFFHILLFMLFAYSTAADSDTVKFIPKSYKIHIKTKDNHFEDGDTSKMTFSGNVIVDVDMQKPENFDKEFRFALNANSDMKVTEVIVTDATVSENAEKLKCQFSRAKNLLWIDCEKSAVRPNLKLSVIYESPFGNDMTGFYRSSYKDSSNKTRWLLTTHFEPIYARNVFPCFDEPDLKAIFEISISVPKEIKTVLSNTKLQSFSDEGSNYVKYTFEKTNVPMSTYLVAFTASNFVGTKEGKFVSDYKNEAHQEKVLKTYGRKDIIEKGDAELAQTIGIKAIEELTKYFGLGYAFEKIDLVGIPDFSAGAMENWGHISFREKSLFFNEGSSSSVTKQANVLTITHELVHQWFGNLVTLESWDYIWLNEAFANYFEYVIASKFSETSNWNLLSQLVVNDIHLRAFETDGLTSSNPLNNKITDENLIFSSFNDIPYSKGAAVLRMWDYLFKEKFQGSLKDYLNERKERSSNPTHLFNSFKKVAQMTDETFKTWTDQAGYPVVQVTKKNDSYELTQSRFYWEKSNTKEKWHIPITYSTNKSETFDTSNAQWLFDKLEIKEKCEWIIVNNHQAGYYRVNYDKENWEALSRALSQKNYSKIPELNRAQIVNDVFSLARSVQKEYVDYKTALRLADYLKNETSFVALKTALSSFDFLQTKLYKEEVYDKFKEYVLSLIQSHFKTLKSTKLDHVDKLKNIEISRWVCALDYEPCVKEAKALFSDSSYSKFPDTQEIVLCTVVRNDNKTWEQVFNRYKDEEDSSLKLMYISSLGCTSNATKAEEFLNKTLASDSGIRKQDLIYVMSSVINGNLKNVDTAFEFIQKKYQKIATDFGGMNPLGKALTSIAKKINTKNQLDKLQALVKKIQVLAEGKPPEESIKSALEIAKSNVDWVQGKMDQCREYFNSGSFVSYSFALLLLCLIFVCQF